MLVSVVLPTIKRSGECASDDDDDEHCADLAIRCCDCRPYDSCVLFPDLEPRNTDLYHGLPKSSNLRRLVPFETFDRNNSQSRCLRTFPLSRRGRSTSSVTSLTATMVSRSPGGSPRVSTTACVSIDGRKICWIWDLDLGLLGRNGNCEHCDSGAASALCLLFCLLESVTRCCCGRANAVLRPSVQRLVIPRRSICLASTVY